MFCTLCTPKMLDNYSVGLENFWRNCLNAPEWSGTTRNFSKAQTCKLFLVQNLKAAAGWSCWLGRGGGGGAVLCHCCEERLWWRALEQCYHGIAFKLTDSCSGLGRYLMGRESHGWLVYNLLLCLVMADSLGQSKGQIITYLQKSESRNWHEGPGTWSELNGF